MAASIDGNTVPCQSVLPALALADVALQPFGAEAELAGSESQGEREPIGVPVEPILGRAQPLGGLPDLQERIGLGVRAAGRGWTAQQPGRQGTLHGGELAEEGGDRL